jgi:hypothetical protein
MIGIIALALSILVMLSGLYLLAKSKKDSLGNLYVFSSYSAIVLGALMFAGTVVGGACMMSHHKCKAQSSCHMMAQGGQCQMNASCGHMQGNCAGQCRSHEGFGHRGANCGHGDMKASCSHGMGMGKMGSCKMHKEMIIEKTVMDDGDDDEDEMEK